jgi:NDP-sugar pyrophosphorylase family protein
MSDIITNLPLKSFKDYHLSKKADATISMKMIDEYATKYGNTILDNNGKIQLFLEKPSAQEIYLSSLAGTWNQEILPIINTGMYCFKKETAKECIMDTNFMDFGKEIFPFLLENKFNLYGFIPKSNYYWMDIGNPKTYLWANWDILREYGWPLKPEGDDHSKNKIYTKDELNFPPSSKIKSRVCLGRNIQFGENILIDSLTVIGNNVKIGNGTIINKSVIWDNVEIGEKCIIDESVIADGCKIADNVTIRSESILGPDVYVNKGLLLDSSTISSKKEVS